MLETTRLMPGPDRDTGDGDIDLGAYVRALWRHRWIVALGMALSMAGVLVASLLRPTQYEASAVLILNQPKLDDSWTASAANATTGTATVSRLLFNRGLAAMIVSRFALDKPPIDLNEDIFLDRLEVEQIAGTNLIRVSLTLAGPQLAADVVNAFATEAVALNRRLNQGEASSAQDFLRGQLEQAKIRFQRAEAALLDYRRKAQVDLVRRDTQALLNERGKILALLVEIEAEKARLAKAEEELAKQPQILTVKKSIDADPALMEAARSAPQSTALLGLQMQNELINPVHETLEREVATSRTKLSALERQRREMVDVLKLDAVQMGQFNALFTKETEIARLDLEYDVAAAVYKDLSMRFEQSRFQIASRTPELLIVDAAGVPAEPASLGPATSMLLAAAGGFVVFALGALLADYLRRALTGPRRSHGA